VAFFEQKSYKQLLKQCDALLKKDPKQVEVKIFAAMAKQRLGEPREAIAMLSAIVKVCFVWGMSHSFSDLMSVLLSGPQPHRFGMRCPVYQDCT
jgi:hypothetical protein